MTDPGTGFVLTEATTEEIRINLSGNVVDIALPDHHLWFVPIGNTTDAPETALWVEKLLNRLRMDLMAQVMGRSDG
jgi:hypothetical protein